MFKPFIIGIFYFISAWIYILINLIQYYYFTNPVYLIDSFPINVFCDLTKQNIFAKKHNFLFKLVVLMRSPHFAVSSYPPLVTEIVVDVCFHSLFRVITHLRKWSGYVSWSNCPGCFLWSRSCSFSTVSYTTYPSTKAKI